MTASVYTWSLGIQRQKPPSEGSKLSSITLCQQSSNSALPANKCSCLLQRLTGWGEMDTVQTPSLLLEDPPSPHADTHNPAKEVHFKHKGHLPSLCCLTELCPLPAACAVPVSQVACADPGKQSCHSVPLFPMAENH